QILRTETPLAGGQDLLQRSAAERSRIKIRPHRCGPHRRNQQTHCSMTLLPPRRPLSSSSIPLRSGVLFATGTLLLAVLLTGCAYTLGPTNGQIAGAKSVQVNPFA